MANISAGQDTLDADMRNAVNGLVSSGTVVVVAAGNEYDTLTIVDPGRAERCITVGAMAVNGEPRIVMSSTGAGVDIDELILLPPLPCCQDYYVVAKWVSGGGNATVTIEYSPRTGIAQDGRPPKPFNLGRDYPNPFDAGTTIPYSVPGVGKQSVNLKIYDVRGRLVRTLVRNVQEPGDHEVFWDATDNRGARVAAGVYFASIEARGKKLTRSLTLVR